MIPQVTIRNEAAFRETCMTADINSLSEQVAILRENYEWKLDPVHQASAEETAKAFLKYNIAATILDTRMQEGEHVTAGAGTMFQRMSDTELVGYACAYQKAMQEPNTHPTTQVEMHRILGRIESELSRRSLV